MIKQLLEIILRPLQEPLARLAEKRGREYEEKRMASRTDRPWKVGADAYDLRVKRQAAKKAKTAKAAKAAKSIKVAKVAKVAKVTKIARAARAAPAAKTAKPVKVAKVEEISATTAAPTYEGQALAPVTPDTFFDKYVVRCFFHFTDSRNISSIRESGGLLSMQAMRDRGISVPAPGGDANSQLSDSRVGMDRYVHLCLFNQNPMEYRARQDGRIEDSRFIEIDRDVLRLDGVLFTSAMANQSGVVPLTLEQAAAKMDFSAAYERMDWSVPEQMQRVLAARKYELLVPDHVPLRYIRNL